ncbi:MAG: DUF4384 domain-containing protein [Spirochaetales bacterium]|nr:DUF4384 domain-containing protein [Spirochaetales bacterium]
MKEILLLTVSSIFLLMQFSLHPLEDSTEKSGLENSFEWSIYTKDSSGNIKTINYEEFFQIDSTMKYQLEILLKQEVFLYIYLYDSKDTLKHIFPADFFQFSSRNSDNNHFILPGENSWFNLTPDSRIKKFYVIASSHRLYEIESMTKSYYTLLEQKTPDTNKINRTKGNILSSLNNLELDKNYFTDSAEKPLPIAGDVRRETKDNVIWIE